MRDQLRVHAWVVGDVEKKPTHADGGSDRARDDEEVCFGLQLRSGVRGLESLGIFGLVEIMEDVFPHVLILTRLFQVGLELDPICHALIEERVVALYFFGCQPFEDMI